MFHFFNIFGCLKPKIFDFFNFVWDIAQELSGPFSKNISKISYFQISQELITLGKKQRVDINWQKIPYKKGLVYFLAKINRFATVVILVKKKSKNITIYLAKSLISPFITV